MYRQGEGALDICRNNAFFPWNHPPPQTPTISFCQIIRPYEYSIIDWLFFGSEFLYPSILPTYSHIISSTIARENSDLWVLMASGLHYTVEEVLLDASNRTSSEIAMTGKNNYQDTPINLPRVNLFWVKITIYRLQDFTFSSSAGGFHHTENKIHNNQWDNKSLLH